MRINSKELIDSIADSFIELKGDRLVGEDHAVVAGLARIEGVPMTIIGHMRGTDIYSNQKANFSMSHPAGFRKAIRLMKQAEKFKRPVIFLIDTIGAYPGASAEKHGQCAAIANCISTSLKLKCPMISLLIGNGGSGGALAFCVTDVMIALSTAKLGVISPEACATVLWNDSHKAGAASEQLKMSSKDLAELRIVDSVIDIQQNDNLVKISNKIKKEIISTLTYLHELPLEELVSLRKSKFREIGNQFIL